MAPEKPFIHAGPICPCGCALPMKRTAPGIYECQRTGLPYQLVFPARLVSREEILVAEIQRLTEELARIRGTDALTSAEQPTDTTPTATTPRLSLVSKKEAAR